jgi:hypothetical protein
LRVFVSEVRQQWYGERSAERASSATDFLQLNYTNSTETEPTDISRREGIK